MKVNILGTEYQVFYETLKENRRYKDCAGYCDFYAKEIHVRKHTEDDEDTTDRDAKRLDIYEQKILRHELIHAFMYESGLHVNSHDITQWAMDEEMTDWFAIQMPKIMAVYNEIIGTKKIETNTVNGDRKTYNIVSE